MRRLRLFRSGTVNIFQLLNKNAKNSEFFSRIKNAYVLDRKLKKFSGTNIKSALDNLKKSLNKILSRNSNERFIFLEGKILLKEALKVECVNVESIFFSNDEIFHREFNLLSKNVACHRITNDLMKSISDVETNQGILAFANFHPDKIIKKKELFSIILDKVTDPGNMGTIIRTAASVGCQQILVTKGSVNPWNQKVLRSAMGGHFHIDIKNNINPIHINKLIAKDSKILVADSKASDNSIDFENLPEKLNSKDKVILVIGNEAHGVDNCFYQLKNQGYQVFSINIPIFMDSLNCSIACAIIAFELRKILNKK